MGKFKIYILSIVFLSVSFSLSAQNNIPGMKNLKLNKELHASFMKFYSHHIRSKAKSKPGNYYLKINEIIGLHNFDYNKDNFEDVMIEFLVRPSNSDYGVFNIAVLFKNAKSKYVYIAHLIPNETSFREYTNSVFYFYGEMHNFTEGMTTEKYILHVDKFVKQ